MHKTFYDALRLRRDSLLSQLEDLEGKNCTEAAKREGPRWREEVDALDNLIHVNAPPALLRAAVEVVAACMVHPKEIMAALNKNGKPLAGDALRALRIKIGMPRLRALLAAYPDIMNNEDPFPS